MPARAGGRGRGKGKGTSEPMHLAFISLEHEQVAAALLRSDGTIRERGSRALAIDIARPASQASTGQCYNCYKDGHFARECVSAAACRRCRKTGHTAADCTETAAAIGAGQRVCCRCGDGTHHAGICHWSNTTILEDSDQRIGVATLTRWGTGDSHAGPAAAAAAPRHRQAPQARRRGAPPRQRAVRYPSPRPTCRS